MRAAVFGECRMRLCQIIEIDRVAVLQEWHDGAAASAAARGLDRPELMNVMPKYVQALADAGDELGKFTGRRREYVEAHLASRMRHGFHLAAIVEEFGLLGRVITSRWRERPQ